MSANKIVQSMTGYAALSEETRSGRLSIELRCVNARFLDLNMKIPDDLRAIESSIREELAARIGRGKLECRIGLQRRLGEGRQPAVDRGLLAAVLEAAAQVQQQAPAAAPLSVADLLRWPGVLVESSIDPEQLQLDARDLSRRALAELVSSREREGARLAEVILERIARIDEIVQNLQASTPALLKAFGERLSERLRNALTDAASGTPLPVEETMGRVRQEVTVYGMRIDVAEELARLTAHTTEVKRVLQRGGPVGKRLDFLMQELNREANTLGSKAAGLELSNASMDLKLLIEQIREQVQNLE